MKKCKLYWCFIAVILLLAVTLSAGTLIFGPAKAGANEQLSKAPVLIKGDGTWNSDFLGDAAEWLADHFFLRQELISAGNWLSANVFKTCGSEDVILGKEGWLFYADTLADFGYLEPFTAWEGCAIANNLELMAEYVEGSGRKFLFAVAPNKNSLYPETMPDRAMENGKSNWMALFGSLEHSGVPYVNLFSAFRAQNEVLYFTHDSHWNSEGAALGADVINEGFGIKTDYFSGDFSKTEPHNGDLYEMLYPAFRDSEENPVYGGELHFTYTGNGKSPDSITLETAGTGKGKLLAYRDSFGNLLYPYLADSYGEAYFSRSTVYDLTMDADFVLIELVERNLRYLITYVPVMPSPVREIAVPEAVKGMVKVEVTKGKAPEGYLQYKGNLPEWDIPAEIYVICGEEAYEAFLLKDGGFAVNVPGDTAVESVIYIVGGEQKLLTVQ